MQKEDRLAEKMLLPLQGGIQEGKFVGKDEFENVKNVLYDFWLE